MGLALPKIFDSSVDKGMESHKTQDVPNKRAAANDEHYGHHKKKKSTGEKIIGHGLKMAFNLAVGAALGFSGAVALDLFLIDSVHYPNEAMQIIKNGMLHYGQPALEYLGISGDGGLLHDFFKLDAVANVVEPFTPASTVVSTAAIGQGVTASALDSAVQTGASAVADAPLKIDPVADMMDAYGL